MTNLSPAEREILNNFRLVSTPKADLSRNRLWTDLQRRGLLSIRPITGDRSRVRVKTTQAGMDALAEAFNRRFSS